MQIENAAGIWCLVVGHAPYWNAGHDDASVWWSHFSEQVQKCPAGAHMLCMIDANAPLATHQCEFFGSQGAEPAGATEVFESTLKECGLFVPQTFEGIHQGSHGTWKHPKGGWTRTDYIQASKSLAQGAIQSQCRQAFDLGFTHEDHVPVQMAFQAVVPGMVPQNGAFRIDRQQCQDPEPKKTFQDSLADLPWPVWHIDQEAHAEWLVHQIKCLALQHFPTKKGRQRPPWMSHETIEWIVWKRQTLNAYRQVQDLELKDDLKCELRQLEKMVRMLCKRDRSAFFDKIVEQLAEAGQAHDTRLVMQKLAMLGRKKKQAASKALLPKVRTLENMFQRLTRTNK